MTGQKTDVVAVLTAAAGVTPDMITRAEALLALKGGRTGAHRRLGATAVEISVRGVEPGPMGMDDADLNVLPDTDRAKDLLIADMDSTIIGVECIDELADFVGKKAEVAGITERAMQGELDFEAALDARVALLDGVTSDDIASCHRDRVRLNPGAAETVRAMNARGAMTALVSGGFTVFADKVAAEAGFQLARANTLVFDGVALAGTVARPIVTSATKLATLNELTAARGLSPSAAIAVGDGANDAEMVKAAGIGVAYRAKPALRAVADATLDHSDLTALLALQGLPV